MNSKSITIGEVEEEFEKDLKKLAEYPFERLPSDVSENAIIKLAQIISDTSSYCFTIAHLDVKWSNLASSVAAENYLSSADQDQQIRDFISSNLAQFKSFKSEVQKRSYAAMELGIAINNEREAVVALLHNKSKIISDFYKKFKDYFSIVTIQQSVIKTQLGMSNEETSLHNV